AGAEVKKGHGFHLRLSKRFPPRYQLGRAHAILANSCLIPPTRRRFGHTLGVSITAPECDKFAGRGHTTIHCSLGAEAGYDHLRHWERSLAVREASERMAEDSRIAVPNSCMHQRDSSDGSAHSVFLSPAEARLRFG